MKRLTATERFETDLVDTFVWTIERFGMALAESYRDALLARCRALAEGRVPARTCRDDLDPELSRDLRLIRSGEHFVIFAETAEAVLLLSILHRRMHLPGALPRNRPDPDTA